jgi:magnesium-transporting ATPase (P-type)
MRNREWIRALGTLDQGKVWSAANEVIVIGAISLAPLVLAAVGSHVSAEINGGISGNLRTDLAKAILSGQLLFYAMSFVASVVWHSSQDLVRPFPLRIWFFFISFCFAMICALTIGVDPSLQKLAVPEVYITSLFIYVISALLYFVILLFRSMEEVNFQKILNREDTEFEDKLKASRGLT